MALLNLVSNASTHARRGRLAVRASAQTERSASTSPIRRRDRSGLLPRIFEPWVTTKAAGRGTGLGLSITRDVIARHRRHDHRGERARRGPVFTISLPADRQSMPRTRCPNILIVDDDARDVPVHGGAARRAGPRHSHGASGPTRRSSRAREPFDLVISDINLKRRESGLDVLRAFKAGNRPEHVVLISGFGTLRDGDRGRARTAPSTTSASRSTSPR